MDFSNCGGARRDRPFLVMSLANSYMKGLSRADPSQQGLSGTDPSQKGPSGTDPSQKGPSGTYPSQMGPSGTDPSQMGLSGTCPCSHKGTFNNRIICSVDMYYLHCPSGSRVFLGRCLRDTPSSVARRVLLGVFNILYVWSCVARRFSYYTCRTCV